MFVVKSEEVTSLFASNLHECLKNQVNAAVHVRIRDDVLYVKFIKYGKEWNYSRAEISYDILRNGTIQVASEIIERFKRDVLNAYFY